MNTILRRLMPSFEFALLLLLGAQCAVGVWLYNGIVGFNDLQFLWLADAFVHGRLDIAPDILPITTAMDMVVRDGRYYWPLGPLPAVLMAPAVAVFGRIATVQWCAQILFAHVTFGLAWLLARRNGFGARDAAWLALAFCFGSIMIGVIDIGMPWHMGNLLTVLFLLAALVERAGESRPAVIGACLALALSARPQALPAVAAFFIADLLAKGIGTAARRRLAVMAAPIALVAVLLGAYNAARFGSPFSTGQEDHYLAPGTVADRREAGGVFSLANVPENFRWYFLALPERIDGLPVARPEGVSAILLSPIFLWLAFARGRDAWVRAALLATAVSLLMYLSYFGTGARQFGPRYLTDVLPLWFAALLPVFRRRGFGPLPKSVIAVSVFANVLLFHLFAATYVFRP